MQMKYFSTRPDRNRTYRKKNTNLKIKIYFSHHLDRRLTYRVGRNSIAYSTYNQLEGFRWGLASASRAYKVNLTILSYVTKKYLYNHTVYSTITNNFINLFKWYFFYIPFDRFLHSEKVRIE